MQWALTLQVCLVADCGRESVRTAKWLKRAIDRPKRIKPRHKIYLMLPAGIYLVRPILLFYKNVVPISHNH